MLHNTHMHIAQTDSARSKLLRWLRDRQRCACSVCCIQCMQLNFTFSSLSIHGFLGQQNARARTHTKHLFKINQLIAKYTFSLSLPFSVHSKCKTGRTTKTLTIQSRLCNGKRKTKFRLCLLFNSV